MEFPEGIEAPGRRGLSSALVALLLVSAGCSGFLGGSETATPTAPSPNSTQTQLTPVNGTDLRTVTVPETDISTADGELDGSDPRRNGTPYEPVQFEADAGTYLNITMQSDEGQPAMRLIGPRGQVLDTTGSDSNTATFTAVNLSAGGQYTIEATADATADDKTFAYTLIVERHPASRDELFAGPRSTWNETERYLVFGDDYADTVDNIERNITVRDVSADARENYIIVTYQMNKNYGEFNRFLADASLTTPYAVLDQTYRNDSNDIAVDETWIPERIYHRELTSDGELYRTTYVDIEWARDFDPTDDPARYQRRFMNTIFYGPAHPQYTPGGNFSTTEAAFPEETYANFTIAPELQGNSTAANGTS